MSTSNSTLPPGVPPTHSLGPFTALIDQLRTFTKNSAANGQSSDLGTCLIATGPTSEALIPIFFRCTWPVGSDSRHKLMWMRPSLSDEEFGTAINDAFDVIGAAGAIQRTTAVWLASNPFTDLTPFATAARDEVKRTVGLTNPPTCPQTVKMMGEAMNGFMQVVVEPLQDATKCRLCGQRRPVSQHKLDLLRKSAFGIAVFCTACVQEHGREELQRRHDEAEDERRRGVML